MDPTLRILDAAANRAREGLRVMEDAARLRVGDQPLTATLKELRHALAAALEESGLGRTLLASHRDTPADVGTRVTVPGEATRDGLRGVVLAAGARVGEAFRSVEECCKAVGGRAAGAAPIVEALRYRAYTAEQTLILALGAGRPAQWRLCVLITESLCRLPWQRVARAAIDAGAECLQLREKSLEGGELLRRAALLVELAAGRSTVVVNDRPDVALAAGADGVHLGQTDLPVRAVRQLAGSSLLVGVSTSRPEEARAAVRDGADYLGLGPMFQTTTKRTPEIRGPDYVRRVLADPVLADTPHLAIGGITAHNAARLAAAGCRGVAVSSAVCSAGDPGGACAAILAAFGAAAPRASPG